jgi:hypothetical protein
MCYLIPLPKYPNQTAEDGRRELDPLGSDESFITSEWVDLALTVLGIPAVNNCLSLDIAATGNGCWVG